MSPALPPPPRIFTLTGNLLAERTLEFEHWTPGKTQRARHESFQVGGKGINVSKMLNRLGVANTALCFAGGEAGRECESWLTERGFTFRAFETGQPTRQGTVIRDASGAHAETTFLGADVAPSASAISTCADFLDAQDSGHVLALCGSLPGWTTPAFDPLRAAIDRWMKRGILAVDTYGAPLADLVRHPLSLLKINADELRTVSATGDIPSRVQRSIITDGPGPVKIRDDSGHVATLVPPPVKEVSPTGSGDVLFACVLEALFVRKMDLEAAVVFAIPFAAANAAHPGIAEFPPF